MKKQTCFSQYSNLAATVSADSSTSDRLEVIEVPANSRFTSFDKFSMSAGWGTAFRRLLRPVLMLLDIVRARRTNFERVFTTIDMNPLRSLYL